MTNKERPFTEWDNEKLEEAWRLGKTAMREVIRFAILFTALFGLILAALLALSIRIGVISA